MRIRDLFGALWLLAGAGTSLALEPPPGKPPVRNYLMAEYQGHLNNWVVRQGPDQRIYVGGGDGLVIFDGAGWQSIRSRHRSRIRVMEVDRAGRIWTGSPDEFGYFAPSSEGALLYTSLSDMLPDEHRNFGPVRGVQLIEGAVYFNALRRLFRWRHGELMVVAADADEVFRVSLNHRNRFLVAVGNRLIDYTEFPPAGMEVQPEQRWQMPEGPRLSFLTSWPDGRILMGSVDDGLFWLGENGPQPLETAFDFSQAWPYRAVPAPGGGMLVGSQLQGLFHLGPGGEALEQITHRNGLAVNSITDLVIDHEQGVWLAQDGAIARVDLFGGRRIYDADFGVSNAHALVPFKGRWLVGGLAGLGVLSADGHDASRLDSIDFPILEVFEILGDGDGLLVAGSDGVHRVVPDLERMTVLNHETLLADSYSFGLVRSRLRDAVYAELESGLGVLLRTDEGWRALGPVEGVVHRAHSVAEDADGRVWVGTVAGRYYRLAWQGEELVLEAVLDAEHGVPEGYAWAFNVGRRLVLGTSEGGYRPVPGGGRIEADPDFGNDRLGEPRGVYRLYGAGNGQVIGGIGPGGALWRGALAADGRFDWQGRWLSDLAPAVNWFIGERGDHLWIGRHPGLIRLDWPPLGTDSADSRLQVVRAGFPDAAQWLIAGPGAGGRFDPLSSRAESLRFEYALTSYTAPDRTEYRVRLEGLEKAWSRWSGEARRDYTNLPGGEYVFRVQARNAAGMTFESEPLPFRVQPPFFLTPLAWGLYALVGLMLLGLAARSGQRVRERSLLARQRVLAEQVAERTTEVRAQAREIRRISDARARFFANVSHELRTPLTLTRAPLQELARTGGERLDAESKRYLDVALHNSEAMHSLIGQVLDMQRLDAGRMPLKLIEADLAVIVRGIVDRFAVQARLRRIELTCDGTDRPVVLACDQAHIDTMLSNLLSNAIKFTPDDGRVAVRLGSNGARVEISVTDTGPGIDPADQQAIFERYRQGDQASATSPGSGLGLALVRELAELHGGRVRVESQPGQGACFALEIPADLLADEFPVDPSSRDDDQGVRQTEAASAAATVADMTAEDVPCVLLVDDNAELRAFLRLRLGRSYRIEEAANGAEGLERARALVPDAIITDGLMPVMDGLLMTREIKSDPELAFVPVLMLTSRAAPEDTVRGLEAGADDYLSKPFDSAELAARVAGLIASRRRLKTRMEGIEAEPVEAGESPFMAQVNSVLQAHLPDSQFSVRDWAQLLHMDRTTLFRRLKSETGSAPEEYLREKRLQAAARLLAERAGNVAEVADAVGFASVTHFTRRFRERFETTPAAYARNGGA